jgi:hypothetical protein
MKSKAVIRSVQGLSLAMIAAAGVWAAENLPQAPPPKFDDEKVNEIFVKDAREQLTGARPDYYNIKKPGPAPTGPKPTGPEPSTPGPSDGNAWSALVSAETLESEIKAQPTAIDAAMKATDPRKSTRIVTTNLSVLFGVIQKYDKDVRWKAEAQPLRDEFAKASVNLKAFTDSQKKQVAKVQTDLKDLIQGNPPALSTSLEADAPWKDVADRVPVMHRLEIGQQERLAGMTKDADAVKRNADAVVREAELIAMMARIIQDKSYEFADDETYQGFAKELEKQAVEAVAATKRNDGAAASSAVSKMQKACDDCHGGFR